MSTAAARPKIAIEGVSKTFDGAKGTTHALDNVSLHVGEGEFLCLLGPSGCGKSTLLNLMAALDSPDAGRVTVDGEQVRRGARGHMMMFQEPALFPWLTVMGNVRFPLNLKPGLNGADRDRTAREFLALVGLEHRAQAHIHELSGGMKQRVALARALAPSPKLLLMDEPFAALDTITREQLYQDLQRIWGSRHVTVVFVTHNVREAVCLGDRVMVMTPHPGRIAGEFPITLPRPRDMNDAAVSAKALEITEAMKQAVEGNGRS
jgi:NitT/TauT family transport system ATP-binding protein